MENAIYLFFHQYNKFFVPTKLVLDYKLLAIWIIGCPSLSLNPSQHYYQNLWTEKLIFAIGSGLGEDDRPDCIPYYHLQNELTLNARETIARLWFICDMDGELMFPTR